tara:strand:+ start:1023 stop:1952 length:930 start_codon:yes stop_codon:yes gene_type:complete
MKSNQFVKFKNINSSLFKILKDIEKQNSFFHQKEIPELKKFMLECKTILDTKKDIRALIICLYPKNQNYAKFSAHTVKKILEIMSDYAGDTLVQNASKEKLIEVYDRDRKLSMHKGSRYHQTREGGSIHTDNVNIPTGWEYLMFGCLSSSKAGGETILVDSKIIHRHLNSNFIEAKKILEQNFYWEKRGVADELYKAPILTYDKKKQPMFRYLRPYLEAAHVKANKKLTSKQLYALDVLDALLETSKFQFRYKMQKGDILFNLDSKVLHGRTSFSDAYNALPLSKIKNNESRLKRTMIRVWIKNRNKKN